MNGQAVITPSGAVRAAIEPRKEVGPVAVIAFFIVVTLWSALTLALVMSPGSMHELWRWFVDLPWIPRLAFAFVFLPWVIAMWIWETSWPLFARGFLVAGVAWANVNSFWPWR